ncbi:MAG: hypothetical protein ACOYOQ_15975, partial [Microthrixaceae bacterium]
VVGAHCPMCGHRCGADEGFCTMCGHRRLPAGGQATPAMPAMPAQSMPYASSTTHSKFTVTPARSGRRIPMVVAGVLALAVLIGGAAFALTRGGDSTASAVPDTPTSTTSLKDRTTQLAQELTAILCPTRACIDSSTPGVLTYDSKPLGEYDVSLVTSDELEQVATTTGIWSPADAKRMVETRALDGTRTSANGAVTWTYHPTTVWTS